VVILLAGIHAMPTHRDADAESTRERMKIARIMNANEPEAPGGASLESQTNQETQRAASFNDPDLQASKILEIIPRRNIIQEFRCTADGCSARFEDKRRLTRHQLCHDKPKFVCECGVACFRSDNLLQHQRTQHK